MKKSPLRKVSEQTTISPHGIVKLLLADHKLLKRLMKDVKSQRATPAQARKSFVELKKEVLSHVKAEEVTFLALVMDHPKFKDHAFESYEEHRTHEMIFEGIAKIKDLRRKTEQMKIYCEMLEHHLEEEEKDLFPRFRRIFAASTKKKAGSNYLKARKASDETKKKTGSKRYTSNRDK
jgi:hemerythrin superfamily protein